MFSFVMSIVGVVAVAMAIKNVIVKSISSNSAKSWIKNIINNINKKSSNIFNTTDASGLEEVKILTGKCDICHTAFYRTSLDENDVIMHNTYVGGHPVNVCTSCLKILVADTNVTNETHTSEQFNKLIRASVDTKK